ncbi:DoxX family protein [Actinocorallia sp. A-T 12471]|uniref:DoxX family protein n=1 Tax=Actinocorallia sp. A-T 12471 TaxID=3089813 RepID=UPI0029D06D5E|nr:DoxX family protein [Actinocorallia sp. A-T 12471]MDX6741062.1 DoxX family protein [Actinocorallia sp. A-T 12471]
MNIALWIAAGLLAAAFLFAGAFKAAQPPDKLVATGLGWVEDWPAWSVKAIGIVEVLGAIGLVLPALVDILPILVPLAATGLAITMVGAIVVHARRKENQSLPANLLLLALSVFVAWGRFGPHAF